MERNDVLIGGKGGGYSAAVGGLRDVGARAGAAIVRAGGASQGQLNAARRAGFRVAAANRAGRGATGAERRITAPRGGAGQLRGGTVGTAGL
jgi:hypothetical protein